MDDLISRHSVLKAINNMVKECDSVYVTSALRNLEVIVADLPSAQPTLYGYSIDHLALIADVMKKEGVSPEEAVRFFNDTQRIYQMLVDEIQKQVEGMVESCVT